MVSQSIIYKIHNVRYGRETVLTNGDITTVFASVPVVQLFTRTRGHLVSRWFRLSLPSD